MPDAVIPRADALDRPGESAFFQPRRNTNRFLAALGMTCTDFFSTLSAPEANLARGAQLFMRGLLVIYAPSGEVTLRRLRRAACLRSNVQWPQCAEPSALHQCPSNRQL